MSSWPSIPHLVVTSTQIQTGNRMLRTAMDAGPAKMRPRFTAAPERVAGDLILTAAQLATFLTFFESTLAGGTLSFDWTHPETGAACTGRFTAPPARQMLSADLFRVSCELEILP